MVLNFHPPTGMERPKYEFGQEARALRSTIAAHEVQKAMTILIASGVLERFPSLQVVSSEYGVGWAPFWLDQVDKAAGTGPSRRSSFPTKLTMRPTEYFKRQMYITYIDDPVGVRYRHDIGIDKIMWSSDYPHAASTWPKSSEFIERDFAGAPPEEMDKVVRANVSKLYGFDL